MKSKPGAACCAALCPACEEKLASLLGWNRRKVRKMLNKSYIPKVSEAEFMAARLGISITEIANFFTSNVTEKITK